MKIAVVKFGGSSLSNSKKLSYVALRIKGFLKKYQRLIVVLSAPGDITDNLIQIESSLTKQKNPSPAVLQIGELLSIALLESLLKSQKIKAVSLNHYQISIKAEGRENNAFIKSVNKKIIYQKLRKNRVVIIPGFIAHTSDLKPVTLGRGGSDYTAVFIAAEFNSPCYLLSDVKGIYSADPSSVSQAKKIERISYSELSQIVKSGTHVRHSKAIEFAIKHRITLYLGSTFHPDEKPTEISDRSNDSLIKFITRNPKNPLLIHLIGKNIEKRKDIIKELSTLLSGSIIKKGKDIITFKASKEISDAQIKDIHNRFVLR